MILYKIFVIAYGYQDISHLEAEEKTIAVTLKDFSFIESHFLHLPSFVRASTGKWYMRDDWFKK